MTTRPIRTSQSHPLAIATLDAGAGRIGISLCPGKQQPDALTGAWARDLSLDLDVIEAWGAAAVVTMVEDHELRALGVEQLGDAVIKRGMRWYHLPIRDYHVPDAAFEQKWGHHGAALGMLLQDCQSVFVHCKGGLGRAGAIAARLLVELGIAKPDEAIAQVRAVRPGAIETHAQEQHVRNIVPRGDAR
jgi:ADP-ribosyl-[dinitrogen reductase] hydrolase